jgi:hypothetical protein
MKTENRFAICVQNEGYPASLELWKVYRVLTDKKAAEHHLVRVIDESGEDYLYDGELSKPATMLVEKISDAIGGIFKPYQIIRVVKAEAQADRVRAVRAESQIEISDLQRRAFHRFLEEEQSAVNENW